MRTSSLAFAVSLVATMFAAPEANALDTTTSINAVAGDASWVALHGRAPTALDAEDDRVATHLRWVERELRSRDVSHLAAPQRAARARMLDVLRVYRLDAQFPRRPGLHGRRPRWVDSTGRHCAVAYLVAMSGDPDLVATVQRTHEHDYVRDMTDVPALLRWAAAHGFTLDELALIQPTYDDGPGIQMPDRSADRRRSQPLTTEVLTRMLGRSSTVNALRYCAGERTGSWRAELTVAITPPAQIQAVARIRDASGGIERAMERCARRALTEDVQVLIGADRYRASRRLRAAAVVRFDNHGAAEVEAALLARHPMLEVGETSRARLASCFESLPDGPSVRLAVQVIGYSGEVRLRHTPATDPGPERRRQLLHHCVQRTVLAGPVAVRSAHDYDFVLEVSQSGEVTVVERSVAR